MRRAANVVIAVAVLAGIAALLLPWGSTVVPGVDVSSALGDDASVRLAAVRWEKALALQVRPVAHPRAQRRAPVRRRIVTVRSVRHVRIPSSAAYQMASLIDQVRRAHGLGALHLSSALASGAYDHSQAMSASGSIYHSSSSQMWHDADRACSCSRVGEIVGMSPTITRMFDAFMGSSVHRSEILSGAYRYMGVGVVRSGGSYWVTVRFAG